MGALGEHAFAGLKSVRIAQPNPLGHCRNCLVLIKRRPCEPARHCHLCEASEPAIPTQRPSG